MIYAIWTHAFHLPGATTDQFSCDVYFEKAGLIKEIIDLLEGNREPIINLGMNDDAEFDEALKVFTDLIEDPKLEDQIAQSQ